MYPHERIEMDDKLLDALQHIPPSDLSYQEWINVGMALKSEGYDVSVWDDWSRSDKRYHPGECERKWEGFGGSDKPVKAGTIFYLAKERGYKYFPKDGALDWDAEITDDGPIETSPKKAAPEMTAAEQITAFLTVLFREDEYVSYVTNDAFLDEHDGRWKPGKGCWDRTAGELLKEIAAHPDDLGAVFGDPKKEAGAWIRMNPVKAPSGKGIMDSDLTRFDYALVESDSMNLSEQKQKLIELKLPIACLVYSGGKSLHAVVKVGAKDKDDFKSKVRFLFDFCDAHGFKVDRNNANPSRMTRMPGMPREGRQQTLLATNMGLNSWADWKDYADGVMEKWPPVEEIDLKALKTEPPKLKPELIEGVLRESMKMIIAGPSKAGKSFLLIELAIALATGGNWMGSIKCKKTRVFYINLEIDAESFKNRILKSCEAMKVTDLCGNICIWNMRGRGKPLMELTDAISRRVKEAHCGAVIIDPIYKVLSGDENKAGDMSEFVNCFDKIADATGAAVIYCHHFSKGAQGSKNSLDRASGSGVFARDPDAQLTLTPIEVTEDMQNMVIDGDQVPFRMEFNLREFENHKPMNIWFEYPLHTEDTTGALDNAPLEGSMEANLSRSSKRTTENQRKELLDSAYEACSVSPIVRVSDLAEYSGVSKPTIYSYIKEFCDEYTCEKGIVTRSELFNSL